MNREDIIRMAREAGLSHMPGWVESGWGYDNLERFAALVAAAALAEPEDWELRRLREELERCKQTCAATSEAWREEAALAEQTVPSDCPDSHQSLTIKRLRDALVASRIIPPAAVEDPDEYDDGVTLFRIEALHRRIT